MMTQAQKQSFENAKYLFVDMDGTLVATDAANNAAYQKAVYMVTGKTLDCSVGRITKGRIFREFSFVVASSIVSLKNSLFPEFLSITQVNSDLVNTIMKSGKKTFVVSHSNPTRGESVLKYHSLYQLMDNNLFFECNKFNLGIQKLGINPEEVFVFENEEEQKHSAIKAGISENNIYLY